MNTSIDTLGGITHKFTVADDGRLVDCYLKIGFVGEINAAKFPMLKIGDICFIDLTVTNKTDETKGLEIMFQVVSEFLKDGANIDSAIRVMKFQRTNPVEVSHDDELDLRGSICDYIGRYLEGLR